MNEDVAKWLPVIAECREEIGVTKAKYSDALMLALIEIESAGDPTAHTEGTSFYGLVQIGRGYAIDACDWLGIDPVDPEDLDDDQAAGRLSILLALAYFERYSSRHSYQQTRIAALHKGGAGSARHLRDRLARGPREESLMQAIEHVEEQTGVHNLLKYIKRFRKARDRWAVELEDHPERVLACYEPTVEGYQDYKEANHDQED